MKRIKYSPSCGRHISAACNEAAYMAKTKRCLVHFSFNESELVASPKKSPTTLLWEFELNIGRNIDAYHRSAGYKEMLERQAEAERVARERPMVIHSPAMSFRSPEAEEEWNKGVANNQDPYGNAVYRFASSWATEMEKRIAAGGTMATMADEASHYVDVEGITGFMYGCAVSMLAHWWIHGEALRLWHNRKTQIGTEGDKANEQDGAVLNPALLTVGAN